MSNDNEPSLLSRPPPPPTPYSNNPFTNSINKIRSNAEQIKTLIYHGKSVTKGSKDEIFKLADGIEILVGEACKLAKFARERNDDDDDPDIFTTFIDEKTTLAIRETIKEEFGKIAKQQGNVNRLAPTPPATYANVAKAIPKTAPSARAVSKPAIVVTAPDAGNSQETLDIWKRNISFKKVNYAPARIQPISGNKIKVEFDTSCQRDETLNKLNGNPKIQAETARKLRPMLILKGIYSETPVDELIDIIKTQNETIKNAIKKDDDMVFCFKTTNKNTKLYNAVFKMAPPVWRCAMDLERINVDHQRVYKEEYSPFKQCYDCLQFGHTRAKCTAAIKPCSHCSSMNHQYKECPVKANPNAIQCYNCTTYNNKYKLNRNTHHSATSNLCPTIVAMKIRISEKIEYA